MMANSVNLNFFLNSIIDRVELNVKLLLERLKFFLILIKSPLQRYRRKSTTVKRGKSSSLFLFYLLAVILKSISIYFA